MVTSASCQHLLAVIHFTCTTYYIPSLKIHTTYQRIMSACTFHHSLYVYYIPAHDAIIQLAFEAQMKTEDGCRPPEAHVPGAAYVCKCVSVCVRVCACACTHGYVCRCVCVCVRARACAYMHTCIHMLIPAQRENRKLRGW